MAAEAFEAVVRVAEVVEATVFNIKRPCINESGFRKLDSFASEASHVCHMNKFLKKLF